MIGSMYVLDVLQERGYEPQEDSDAGESWFDLSAAGVTVRAILAHDGDAEIHVFTGPLVCQWSVRFANVPAAVFLAALDAAEREAGMRTDRSAAVRAWAARQAATHGEDSLSAKVAAEAVAIVDGQGRERRAMELRSEEEREQ